jgi:preprotein translocase subunit YajC
MLTTNLLPLATSTASSTDAAYSTIYMIVMFLVLILIFYFLLIRPQHKKEKQTQKMRSSLQVGDEITTVGGIVGRIVTIKDDSLVIETGADRNKMRIKKWAVQSCDTVHDEG